MRKLLTLQGLSRPQRIVSLMSYPDAAGALASPSASQAIDVAFGSTDGAAAHAAGLRGSALTPSEWIKLIARLGEIPDPTVGERALGGRHPRRTGRIRQRAPQEEPVATASPPSPPAGPAAARRRSGRARATRALAALGPRPRHRRGGARRSSC